jgi:hypothetical protein
MSNEPEGTPDELAHLGPLPKKSKERAPKLLKQAARMLVIGSLFPWTGLMLAGNGLALNFGLKLVVLAGCWMLLKAVHAHHQASAAAGFGARPIVAGRPGMLGALNGLHVTATIVIVLGLVLGIVLLDEKLALGESISLLLGGLTFVHIDSYEKGGKFNPLFPLMFLGCALGGPVALVARIQHISNGAMSVLAALGCAIVTTAGILAVYTIAVALLQAKKEGDLKKAAAIEARKLARGAAKSAAESREPTV